MIKKYILISLFAVSALSASAQRMEVASPSIDCGQVQYRNPVSADFEIRNKGNRPLRIDEVRVSCGCTTVDYPKTEIAADGKFSLHVTYDALQMGSFDKLVAVYANGEMNPLVLHLKGRVVQHIVDFSGSYPFKLGSLLADKTDLEYDDVNRGELPQQKIHIRNTTSGVVQPVVMHLPNYLRADVSPSKIAPGHSGVVTITLDSRLLKDLGLTQTSVYLGQYPGDKVSHEKEISISAVLLPKFDQISASASSAVPRLTLSTTELNLGPFGSKKKLKGEVIIRNDGQATLDIKSLQMFTAGLQVSLNKTKLAPGEEAKMKVTAEQRQLRNLRTKPRILMITNDPQSPKVVVHIITE